MPNCLSVQACHPGSQRPLQIFMEPEDSQAIQAPQHTCYLGLDGLPRVLEEIKVAFCEEILWRLHPLALVRPVLEAWVVHAAQPLV